MFVTQVEVSAMVKADTLSTLAELEREMAQAGRSAAQAALQEAIRALSQPVREFLTIEQAAQRLGLTVEMVEGCIERGALEGGTVEGRRLVAAEGVESMVSLREALRAIEEEGFPTDEEIRAMYNRPRRQAREERDG
jgi:hypothetical protein